MEIKTIEIAGLGAALTALRLPFGKEVRSAVIEKHQAHNLKVAGKMYDARITIGVNDDDLKLMQTLNRRGAEHAKVLRGVVVWASITAPVYWWCECETYVVGHQRLSSESTMHIDCRGLSGAELVAAKAAIPMGKELTKVDAFSYQCLRNIVRQRYNHRLPEWHTFVDWVKTLPFAQELILDGLTLE